MSLISSTFIRVKDSDWNNFIKDLSKSTGGSGGSTPDFQAEGSGFVFLSPIPMEIF